MIAAMPIIIGIQFILTFLNEDISSDPNVPISSLL
jgi:hypothetical protein